MKARWLFVVATCGGCLISAAGCKDDAPDKQAAPTRGAPKKRKPPAQADLLAQDFAFRCSAQAEVACKGVFPVRGAAKSKAAVLWSGEDALRARILSLKQARRSIRIQALIFRGDETGLHIANLLKQKRKAGLEVRVIVDAASNLDWHTQWMYFDLKRSGVEVEGYEAMYMHWVSAEKPADPLRANKRFHDKMWIIDAEEPTAALAIVGGLNIANEYFRVDPTPLNRWQDQDVVLRGPLVADVTRAFDRNYDFFKGIKRKRPSLLNTDNAWKLARKTVARIVKLRRPTWLRRPILARIKQVLAKEPVLDFRPVVARFVQSRPRFGESFIQQAYEDLIRRAERTLFIANAYFIPSRQLTTQLKAAARRGVRVVILTNSPATNDISAVAVVSRYTYKDLLAVNREARGVGNTGGSIAIHEWSGAPHNEGTLHAKFAVADGKEAIIGSYNLDPRSERLNSETAVALRDAALIGKLSKYYVQHLLPRSARVSWDQAAKFRRPKDMEQRFKLLFALPLEGWL